MNAAPEGKTDAGLNARRFTAAALAMQGLLSGNGMFRAPDDAVCAMFARDAVRLGDAMLAVLDSCVVEYVQPTLENAVYKSEYEMLTKVQAFDEHERRARERDAAAQATAEAGLDTDPPDSERPDTSGSEAPVPVADPRGA